MPKNSRIRPLDQLDCALLHQLDVDFRQSSAAIARTLNQAEETVRYRMRSLVERSTIVSSLTIINAGLLGYNYFKVLIKLQNPREETVQKIERFLIDTPEVNWVARCETLYDIAFTIRVRRITDLDLFVDELKKKFHAVIKTLTFAINVEVDFLPRDFLVGTERPRRRESAYTSPREERPLDVTDLQILKLLSRDARMSLRSLAKECHCTDETVGDRLLRLEQERVITGYRLVLDCANCGILNYYMLLYLNQLSPERLNKLREFLRAEPALTYYIKAIGPWDYELNLEVFEAQDFQAFVASLTNSFSDLIRDWQAFPVSKVHKLTISP